MERDHVNRKAEQTPQLWDVPVIIPSLEPDSRLPQLTKALLAQGMRHVVVVDDGSGEAYEAFFQEAAAQGATVLRHAVNLGKGRALKTAFNHCLLRFPGLTGCVTADSDGQHAVEDIKRAAEALCRNPHRLVMGCRDFSHKDVPFKNRYGNRITAALLRLLCGVTVTDSQTGLRAIPGEWMETLLTVGGERFEFETHMLLEAKSQGISILELPIETIYQGAGYSSHFHPLRDSIRIYRIFGTFLFSSLAGAAVDLISFALFVALLRNAMPDFYVLTATALARVLSAVVNFTINRRVVFHSRTAVLSAGMKYAALAVALIALSGMMVTLLHRWLGGSEVLIKVPVDALLFLLSFVVQQTFVFKSSSKDEKPGEADGAESV